MNNIIFRSVNITNENESRTITGQAVVFESWSRDLGGFTEIIHKGAITQELVDNADVIMNVDHDPSQMVARSHKGQGTLSLQLKDDGLWFSFEAPTTARGDELLYNVRNGNLFECSFAFSLPNDDKCERWYYGEDNSIKREIFTIGNIYDCSIVTHAAYAATSCNSRGLEIENINIEEKRAELDAQDKAKQDELIKNLDEKMSDIEKYTIE